MMFWLIVVGYGAGVVLSWRTLTMSMLIGWEKELVNPPFSYDDKLPNGVRAFGAVVGLVVAVVWPLSLTARAAYRFLSHSTALMTPSEVQQKEKTELEALRKLAKDHDLPNPEGF